MALLALAAHLHREQLAEQEEARRAVEEAAAQACRRHRPGCSLPDITESRGIEAVFRRQS
ncbi:MAG: hypothetical protein H6816_11220 [Phycisphaerales bacterium]|nr:hypothetical protein [Phycisphaerales bacterium]